MPTPTQLRIAQLMTHFDTTHLPEHLAKVSNVFRDTAARLTLSELELLGHDDDMLHMALEHLLISKDAAVRVAVAKQRETVLRAGGNKHGCGGCGVRLGQVHKPDCPTMVPVLPNTHQPWCTDGVHDPDLTKCVRPLVGPGSGKDGGK